MIVSQQMTYHLGFSSFGLRSLLMLLSLSLLSSSLTNAEPSLPFGDVNVLILTDVHSWVGGHGRHEHGIYDVDYGHVLSFYERLKAYCDNTDKDLWFVMNGDWIDGTGLALDGDPSYLIPLLQKMPWDVINTGNHELYKASVIEYMRRPGGFIDWWGGRHLASNIIMTTTNDEQQQQQQVDKEPFSSKYLLLKGRHSTVLVFGFLYNLPDPADIVTVEKVEEAVEQPWFRNALEKEDYDSILVMAHMGTDDPSVPVIRDAIRKYTSSSSSSQHQRNIPIQFVSGHTHLRRYGVVDDFSTSFEAGRYLDTVGFVSFPNVNTIQQRLLQQEEEDNNNNEDDVASNSTSTANETTTSSSTTTTTTTLDLFQHVFIDANQDNLKRLLGMNGQLDTPKGLELSEFIQTTQERLGLTQKLGCVPSQPTANYYINRTLFEPDSLWGLYQQQVVPTQLEKKNNNQAGTTSNHRAILVHQGSWRYDLLGLSSSNKNELVYDDIVAVSPFDEPIYLLGLFPSSIVVLLNETLNTNTTPWFSKLPEYILAGTAGDDDDNDSGVELYCHHFELQDILDALETLYPVFDPHDITTTNLTSTSIWKDFVLEQWPCPGEKGIHIPWFDNNNNNDNNGNNSNNSSKDTVMVPILTAIFTVIFVCGGCYVFLVTMRQFCCFYCCGGHLMRVGHAGEIEPIKEDLVEGEEAVNGDQGHDEENGTSHKYTGDDEEDEDEDNFSDFT